MSPGGESTVISYASFIAGRSTAPSEADLLLIFQRIGFRSLNDIEAFLNEGPPKFDETYPFLDQRTMDTFMAIAKFCQLSSTPVTAFVELLRWALSQIPQWNLTRFVNRSSLAASWTHAILKALPQSSSAWAGRVTKIYAQMLVENSTDIEACSQAMSGIFEGLVQGLAFVDQEAKAGLLRTCLSLLQSGIFDLGEFLKDCPPGSNVDEILQRHYVLLLRILAFINSLMSSEDFQVDEPDYADLRALLLGYFREMTQFLSHSFSDEPFLVDCCDLIARIAAHRVNSDVGEFIVGVLEAGCSTGQMGSFTNVIECCSFLLYESARDLLHLQTNAVKALKSALAALSQTEGAKKEISVVGLYIGKCLRLILDAGNSVFCETFVSNLAVELPSEPFNADMAYCGIIRALGNIALGVGDESIVRICLSTLTAQFKKTSGTRAPELFFEQFNLIATGGSTASLAAVLDIYVARYLETEQPKALHALSSAMTALTSLAVNDPIKAETLLQAVLRLFVEKGLAIVKAHNDRQRKKHGNEGLNAPIELELLLPVMDPLFSCCTRDTFVDRVAKLEAFQEFWFILIYTGYQESLSWPEKWAPYIPALALATPVLIKEKDRLKAVTTPLSQVLLSQSGNQQMKNDLSQLMPNCSYLTKTLTLPKCLWLLSLYYTENQKLRNGVFGDMMVYMTAEVVKQFELEPFVEDLLSTIIRRWLVDPSLRQQQSKLDAFACHMLEYCCHVQERVHKFAHHFLKMVLENHKSTYSCHALWEAFLTKMMNQYEICRRALGEEGCAGSTDGGALALSPNYARKAFEDLVELARKMFAAASTEYPHDFYAFIQKSLQRQRVFFASSRPGDRDIRMLELLRVCLPISTDNYLSLSLEFQSKPEDYLKWLLSRGASEGITCPGPEGTLQFDPAGAYPPGCLSQATSNILRSSNGVDQLEAIVSHPFVLGTTLAFKEAVYCWAWLLDERPDSLSRFLSLVHQAWQSHVKLGVGYFGKPSPPSTVFSGRMDTQETQITHILPQSSPSIPYVVLVDFLHERLLLRSRSTNPDIMHMYFELLCRMLADMRHLVLFPRLRSAVFKACVLAFEFLNEFEISLGPVRHCILRGHLYGLLMRHFELPHSFHVEDRDFMKYEEGLLLKLRNYVDAEPSRIGRLGEFYAASPQASLLPSHDGIIECARLLRLLLTHEMERIIIWHDRTGTTRQGYLDAGSVQEYLRSALKYSVPLAVQLVGRFPYIPIDGSISSLFNRSAASARVDTLESCMFWLQHGLTWDDERRLLFAPTLPPIAAIAVFRSAQLSARPILVNYAMRSLESVRPDILYFYIPHIVQALRHDRLGYIERTIMHVARTSSLFAHQIIWNMKANTFQDDAGTVPDPCKDMFEAMIEKVSRLLAGIDKEFFEREFAFFDKVTAISGALKPYVKKEKWEKKEKIDEELKKIAVDPGVYLPSNPESIVIDIDYDSGRPLQSHAKAPFMATFRVRPAADPEAPPIWQSVIFKVGDDCRQDVLALQFLTALKNIFAASGLNLYFFPYRVVATAPGCGVIEVIPNSISRDQLGREKINSLYDYFCFRFGNERSPKFSQARENFVKSMAAYSVACYLLAIKDRHNGNIMVNDAGHIIHIDFGFILDLAPGGISVESAFKLTTEMLAVMGGRDDSAPYFAWYRELCCQAFLALRSHAESLIQLVEVMSESGLPCFAKGEAAIRKLRARFHLEMNEADARQFMYGLVYKSCETIRTALYDKYQEKTNGIPY